MSSLKYRGVWFCGTVCVPCGVVGPVCRLLCGVAVGKAIRLIERISNNKWERGREKGEEGKGARNMHTFACVKSVQAVLWNNIQ